MIHTKEKIARFNDTFIGKANNMALEKKLAMSCCERNPNQNRKGKKDQRIVLVHTSM
jgi:hypothetical protein